MPFTHLAFDMDGVVYSAEGFIADAYKIAIESSGLNYTLPSNKQIMAQIGNTIRVIFSNLFPGITEDEMTHLRTYTRKFVVQMVYEKRGLVYEGIPELIKELSQKYTLAACSNGGERYVEAILKTYGLVQYFIPILTLESENVTHKGELLKSYISKNGNDSSSWVMIGDRKPDLEAADFNNCAFIGCNWGHAEETEIQKAEIIVHEPKQILNALKQIENQS